MPGPKFAILTATHEGTFDYLPYCIESARAQVIDGPDQYTYQHVIVSDGSERAWEYTKAEAERDSRIVPVYLEENQGQVAALRAGELALINASLDALHSRGEHVNETYPNYFIVVDGDDGLTPTALSDYSETSRQQWKTTGTIPGVMFGQAVIIDEHGKTLDDVPHIPGYNNIPDTSDVDSFLAHMKVCNHLPSKPAFHWEFFHLSRIPPMINGERVVCVDWLLALSGLKMCRIKQQPISGYVHMPTATSYYRVRSGQASLSESANGAWERERVALVNGEFDPFAPESGAILEACQTLGLTPSRLALREMMAFETRGLPSS